MAVWALGQLLGPQEFAALKARHLPCEADPDVRAEWEAGQDALPAGPARATPGRA
jgi:hypothetical protein